MSDTPEQRLLSAKIRGLVDELFFDVMNKVIFEWRELKAERERGVEVWVCEERFDVDTENDGRQLVLALSAKLNEAFPNKETRAILIPVEDEG